MKIEQSYDRTRNMPLNGVKLDRAEKKTAQQLSDTFTAVPLDTLRLLRGALGEEALRLEAAADWTGVDTEPDRRRLHETVLLHCYAVQEAYEHALARLANERAERRARVREARRAHTLTWERIGTEEPGDQHADSLDVADGCTSAFYEIGPASPSGWSCVLRQLRDGREQEEDGTDFGVFATEDAAKDAADTHEHR